jgi:hypothetical protein
MDQCPLPRTFTLVARACFVDTLASDSDCFPRLSLCTEVAAILGTAAVAVDPIVSCIAAHRFAYVAPDGTVTLTVRAAVMIVVFTKASYVHVVCWCQSGRVPPHPGAPRA